jgi:uncharacterized protein YbdZ (MbtH family)
MEAALFGHFSRRALHSTTRRLALGLAALAPAAILAMTASAPQIATAATSPPPELRVSGNRLVDAAGSPLQFRGVNRSGLEYACIQGWGFFDGPSDAASITAMASWGINVVRVPLNEDCWLGINTPYPAYAGANYRSTVQNYVQALHAAGLAVILDLQFVGPGTTSATGTLHPMPDADHAPAFWTSVATTFVSDKSVIFDLFNEPHDVSWSCWRDGCLLPQGWQAAGMQSLVNAVRATGATQPIIIGGLSYANDMTGWLANAPSDTLGQLAVSLHLYDSTGGCNTVACWDAQVAPVAAAVPVITGELGETDCTSTFINNYMPWADAHGVSYLGWAWDAWNCNSGPSLISSYDGTPTAFGAGMRSHFLSLADASATTTTTAAPTTTTTVAPTTTTTVAPTTTTTVAPTTTTTVPATSLPGAPSLSASTSSTKGVVLTWSAPTTGGAATSYTIYRSRSTGNESSYVNVICTATTCSYNDTGTKRNFTYYYKVAGVNAAGTGQLSNETWAKAI